jgi:hypothetical protein
MKKISTLILGLMAITNLAITPQPVLSMPTSKTSDFTRQPPIGNLGQPLGKITTISGTVRQAALGAKASKLDLVLSVEVVNDQPLSKPIVMPFQIFETAKVVKPYLGQAFKYVGYETGGFTGVPAEAFKWVPAVATTGYRFETVYQILHEDLKQVKTKADLIRSNDQRVQIIGKYIATPMSPITRDNANVVNPNTGNPESKASNTKVNIELADGTRVPLFSPLNKLSNRPAQEVKEFDGKMVSIIGLLGSQPQSSSNKPETSILIVRMDRIELNQAR